LVTIAQVISHNLKLFTRKIFIYILRGLLTRKVHTRVSTLSKRVLTQREESRINIEASLDTLAAHFTLIKMIASHQQFRRGQAIPRVVLNLFLSQVFHRFSI
jgi:hypothetical protein